MPPPRNTRTISGIAFGLVDNDIARLCGDDFRTHTR